MSDVEPRGLRNDPAGNFHDKYRSPNPVARRLVEGFRVSLLELTARADPASLIDVGCGEGVLTSVLADRLRGRRVLGIDRDDTRLRAEWASRARPNVEYRAGNATSLDVPDGDFDAAYAIEVLEHLDDPEAALGELRRAAHRWVIVSAPREPVWRIANVARGAYWWSLGDTPGHVNHWSKQAFISLVSGYGTIEEVRSPFPWTMLLARL